MTNAFESTVQWVAKRIILAYAVGAVLFLSAAGGLSVLDTRGWDDQLLILSPKHYDAQNAEPLKRKIRDALAVMPGTLAKIGVALLGVAAIGAAARVLENRRNDAPASHDDEGVSAGPLPPNRMLDLLVPVVLAALVFGQVASQMNRPLRGDEKENYDSHLVLPLKGVLTSMEGANNQLGFSILAWTSMRVFGDSPFSVRLPALVGALLLPGVVYLVGSRQFGRAGAALFGLLLALWPDCLAAGMQGRSYSLLMLVSVLHFQLFKQFVKTSERRTGLWFAATMAAACTLHMWFVIVVCAELVFLGLVKADDRFGTGVVGCRTPLRMPTFLVYMTLGCLGAVALQAGIIHKFLFILTQKNPMPIDASLVLSSIADCLRGKSFEYIALPYHSLVSRAIFESAFGLVTLSGLLLAAVGARRSLAVRFEIAYFVVVIALAFLVVYIQKPIYLYSRFYVFLPVLLGWAGARGWGLMFSRPASRVAREPNLSELAETA